MARFYQGVLWVTQQEFDSIPDKMNYVERKGDGYKVKVEEHWFLVQRLHGKSHIDEISRMRYKMTLLCFIARRVHGPSSDADAETRPSHTCH